MAGMRSGVDPTQIPQQGTWGIGSGGAQQFDGGTSFKTWTPEADAQDVSAGGIGQYRGGGPNKIVWGGEVTPGSSGGETSFNAATGKQQYVAGYDNTGWSPAGSPGGGGGSPAQAPAGGGGSASLQGLMAASGADAAPPAPDAGAGGDAGGPAGAKVIDPTSDNTSPSMQGLMTAGGGGAPGGGGNMLSGPTHFRGGIGARLVPDQASPLVGSRRIY